MRDQIRRTATYIYINIYTRNLKFAQLVTALASLANYNYGAPLWKIFGDELSECRCDVGLSVRCFRFRSSFIRSEIR